MALPVFLKIAARGLTRNPRRSLITLAAISVGLAGLLFLWAYIGGINQQMVANVTGYLTGHLQLHRRGYHDDPELGEAFLLQDPRLVEALRDPRIAAAAPRIEGQALASGPDKTRGVLVLGIDPAREQAVTTLWRAVREGQYPDASDEAGALLGQGVAETLAVKPGDEVTLVTQAADGSIGAGRYRVRGIFRSGIDFIDDSYLFLPLAAAQGLYALPGQANTLAIRLQDIDGVEPARMRLQQTLGAGYEVLDWKKLLPALWDDVLFHEYMTHIVLLIAFVVVTLGIANTILMGTMERVREFGIMLALGTTAAQLGRSVIYEALLLGAVGAGLGALMGLSVVAYYAARGIDLARYSGAVQMMPGLTGIVYPQVSAAGIAELLGAILGMTLLASLYPAWKASRLAPVDAIRGTLAATRLRGWAWASATLALPPRAVFLRIGLRNLARNPRRTLLTLLALGAGLAAQLFLGALGQGFFLQMRDNATGLLTGEGQIEVPGFRREFDPSLTMPEAERLLIQARAHPGIAAAAPRVQAMIMLSSPTRSEAVMLYGIDAIAELEVTQLHRYVSEGRFLTAGATREIVLGKALAERLGVRVGEKIVAMGATAAGDLGSSALRVAGITATGNDMLDRNVAITGLAAARELLSMDGGEASTIALRFQHIDQAEDTALALQAGLGDAGLRVVSWQALLPEIVQMLDLLQVNLCFILGVVFLIVALGVMNILLMAVLERMREFGLQLALGTRPAQILRTVLYESLVMAVLGLCIGLLLGAVIVGYYQRSGFDLTAYAAAVRAIPGMTGIVYPAMLLDDVLWPTLALFVTSLAAALYPAWRASRLDAAQALRHV